MILFAKDLTPTDKVLLLQIEAITTKDEDPPLQELAHKVGISIRSLRLRMKRLQKKGYLLSEEIPKRMKLEVKASQKETAASQNQAEIGQKDENPEVTSGNVINVQENNFKNKETFNVKGVGTDSTATEEERRVTGEARAFMTVIADSGTNLNFWKYMVRMLGYETLSRYYGRAVSKSRKIRSLPAYIVSLIKADHPQLFSRSGKENAGR